MTGKLTRIGWCLVVLAVSVGCAAPRILGKATLLDEKGAPLPPPTPGVTLNFINLEGKLDESVTAVQTDLKGAYRSAELPPGKYTVEAAMPGYVIERTTLLLGKHGTKKALFTLKKIRESERKSVREGKDDNIPSPGEVEIKPPR